MVYIPGYVDPLAQLAAVRNAAMTGPGVQLRGANPAAIPFVAAPTPPRGPNVLDRILGALIPTGQFAGILSDEDQRAIQRQALFQLGAQLLANSGPRVRGAPGSSFGERIGSALSGLNVQEMGTYLAKLREMHTERQKLDERDKRVQAVVDRASSIQDPAARLTQIISGLAGIPGTEGMIGPLSNALAQIQPDAAKFDLRTAVDPATGKPTLYRVNRSTGESQSLGLETPMPFGATMPSEGERKTGALLQVGEAAYRLLEGATAPSIGEAAAGRLPFGVGNLLVSGERQLQNQAALQLAEAWLRTTTGATATQEEVERASLLLLPQAGDKPETLRQKAASRRTAIEAIRRAAGRAATPANPSNPVTPGAGLDDVPARFRGNP